MFAASDTSIARIERFYGIDHRCDCESPFGLGALEHDLGQTVDDFQRRNCDTAQFDLGVDQPFQPERIGLLSIDFVTGRTLQLTGTGSIHASDPTDEFSERTLVIEIDEVRAATADVGEWTDIEAFELAPNLVNPATPRSAD